MFALALEAAVRSSPSPIPERPWMLRFPDKRRQLALADEADRLEAEFERRLLMMCVRTIGITWPCPSKAKPAATIEQPRPG
jgi:hypothetical protein